MRTDTFRDWLAERGCSFEQDERGRGGLGHLRLTVRCGGRRSTLESAGGEEDLPSEEVLRVVRELGMNASELPGIRERN